MTMRWHRQEAMIRTITGDTVAVTEFLADAGA
jgi:hypothetical protein